MYDTIDHIRNTAALIYNMDNNNNRQHNHQQQQKDACVFVFVCLFALDLVLLLSGDFRFGVFDIC